MSYNSNSNSDSGITVSPGCNYTSLGQYTDKARGVAMPSASFTLKSQLVPSYGMPASYNSLNHNQLQSSCSGYFSINTAYGACPGNFPNLAGANCGRR